MISAVMDVSGGGKVAVLHPSALGGFCHIQLDSSFPFCFSLSFPIWSLRKLAVRWINMLSEGPDTKIAVTGGPLHQVAVVLGGRGVSRESNGRLNSISLHQD